MKKKLSKFLALVLSLQLILTSFSQVTTVYAAEQAETMLQEETETVSEAIPETEAAIETEAVFETEAVIETEAVFETEAVIETEAASETEAAIENEAVFETEAAREAETQAVTEERWNDAPVTGQAQKDGVRVLVSAPEGSFPEGTELRIEAMNASATEELVQSINEGQDAVAFDISFYGPEGGKVQPRDGYTVDIRFEIRSDSLLADPDGEGAALRAYHITDGNEAEMLGSTAAPESGTAKISFQADSFSPYVILRDAADAVRSAPTSTDLSDFLISVSSDAPTDENGAYVIDPNEAYDFTFAFRENENLQFDDEAELVYELPEGLIVPDMGAATFDLGIRDGGGNATISGNTYEVQDGKLIVRFNQDDPNFERLKAVGNAAFNVTLNVKIDENADNIVFNTDIEKDFVFESNSDLTIDKAVVYDMDADKAEYVITVTSSGYNENVTVQDILTGTALILNHDVTVTSSTAGTLNPTIDYDSIENGFSFTVDEMQNGEVLTIRCSADVDNQKLSGTGTVAQTNNTARVASDQVPDGKEATADFAGKTDFHRITKRAKGDPVEVGENLYEQTWTIIVNEDHKILMGGNPISDWIVQNSRPFMHFTGDGITARVTLEDGTTETRELSWNDLRLYENNTGLYGWAYFTPESDGKASYEITCKTLINTTGALGDLTLVNGAQIFSSYSEGTTKVGVIGEDSITIKKEAVGTTATESEWATTVNVPGSGLPEFHIVDDLPKLESNPNIDYLIDGSMVVEGLLEGERWTYESTNSGRTFVLRFYYDDASGTSHSGLLPTADGQPRDIIVRYKTAVDQEWLDKAAENGYASSTLYRHRNFTVAWSGNYRTPTVEASVIPFKATMVKNFVERSEVEIDGVTYPVFRYSISLSGLVEDGMTIHDAFDTRYLRLYEADGIGIKGGRSAANLTNANGTASASASADGMDITIDSFPKNSDGTIYPFYQISYSLIVKDESALAALNEAAAAAPAGIDLENTATWDDIESSRNVNYTYYPYVDKEVVSLASSDNGYVAEFKLIINQFAEDLDPTSDTLNIQDVLSSNLRLVQGSIAITPEAAGMRTQYDSETSTLSFIDVPDNTRFEITYQARVLGKGNVSYSNTVKFGNFQKTVEEEVQVNSSGGGTASNPSITLVKRDAEDLDALLAGASFQLFYLRGDTRVAVTDKNGDNVVFTTGADGSVLIQGNQRTLGWTLWEDRTYQLVELSAPVSYEINETPTEFVLSSSPSSQMEYDIVGDTITALDTKIKTEVPVRKTWIGPAADSVTVYLKTGDTVVRTATLDESTNWAYTFENLDKYGSDGSEIQYQVEEAPLGDYSAAVEGDMSEGYVITNTNTETVDIPVQKQWVGAALDSVTVNLLADDTVIDTATLAKDTGWSHTFTDLPKYDSEDGHEISYDVKEEPIEGYVPAYSGSVENGITITNTITGKVSIPVSKTWVGPAAESVTVTLLAGEKVVGSAVLNEANNWQYTFADLEKYEDGKEISYSVEELNIEGYKSEITANEDGSYTITNTNTETVEIPVTKTWVGPELDSVTVNLLADDAIIDTVELTKDTGWSHTFTDLPKYDSNDGHEISYDIKEEPVEGYVTAYSGTAETGFTITNTIEGKVSIPVTKTWVGPAAESVTVNLLAGETVIDSAVLSEANNWQHTFADLEKYEDGKEIEYTVEEPQIEGYTSEITANEDGSYTIKNTNTETVEVPVQKQWVGPELDSVTVNLLADDTVIETAELTKDTGWSHTFTDLPKYDSNDGHEISYDIKEEPVEGYVTAYSGTAETGFTITNTIEGKVSIPVTKTWVGPAAENVTVNLLAGETVIDSAVLSEANNWQYTFTDLEKYEDGNEISYSVEELNIEGYKPEITANEDGSYTIKNTNTEKLSIPVTKKWVGKSLDQVTIRLMADGKEVGSCVLTEKENWKHTFSDLPKYDPADGHEVRYTVTEDAVEGYITSISGSAPDGYTVTNTKKDTPKPPTPEKKKPKTPKTGDESNVGTWLSMLLFSGGLLFWLIYRRKRKA